LIALHDCVSPTLHVAEHGHGAVSWFGGFAGGTRVCGIESNAVGPAVIDNGAICHWQLVSNGGGGK